MVLKFQVFSIQNSRIVSDDIGELTNFMEENDFEAIESTEEEQQQNQWAEEDLIFVKKKPEVSVSA